MNDDQKNTIDHDDRLLDRALCEVIGSETPPDLSECILAAAAQQTAETATVATGDEAMNEQHFKRKTPWLSLAVAATLLFGFAALMMPAKQASREAAQSANNLRDVQNDSSPSGLQHQSKEAWEGGINEEFDPNLSIVTSQTQQVHAEDSPSADRSGFVTQESTPKEQLLEGLAGDAYAGTTLRVKVSPAPMQRSSRSLSQGRDFGFGVGGYGGDYGGKDRSSVASGPLPQLTADLDIPNRQSSFGLATPDRGLAVAHQEVRQKLQQKIARYRTLSEELAGSNSSVASTVLNQQINEVRQIQTEMVGAKKQLVEIDVNRALAEQAARSPVAIEKAVKVALGKEPTVVNYEAEQFALSQRIRELQSDANHQDSPEVKRLRTSINRLGAEAQQYKLQREAEIRSELKAAPDDTLAQAMTRYVLKRDEVKSKLAKLETDYKTKVRQIRAAGQRSGEVALLESEIKQLQEIERQLAREAGTGPGTSGDQYTRIYENPFIVAEGEKAVSTFSIDVDTASYANVRQFLMQSGQLPPPDAVRIEELVNYFDYDYSGPTSDVPFAAHVEIASCPWHPEHRLVRVGIKGREIERQSRPQSNLVFLIDVSGSMNEPAKLPLLVEGMKLLTRELGENDRVAIVVYASSEGLALPSTRGDKQDTILAALENLRAGGSTAGGAGIQLAYQIAQDHFIDGGVNRVILATDGDFNVGTTSTGELERMAEQKAKDTGVFLTVLGFGRGNLNDAMMEAISGKGNGNYHYVDNRAEARKVLVDEMAGTLVTIAKDVKLQIEFNPALVAGYRLIGYENRMLRTEDFNDDKKDAGEIGAGHTVTALYEIVPSGKSVDTPGVDPLKYQAAPQFRNGATSEAPLSDELLTLKIRYKQPDGDTSTKLEFPITDAGGSFAEASDDFKFAAAVASFGMLLRDSEHRGNTSYAAVLEIAEDGASRDLHGYRAEFLKMVRQAKALAGE